MFRLTVLPEEQEQVTDYSCRAENSLGSSRATVLLSGLPAPPVISSGELSARQTRYTRRELSGLLVFIKNTTRPKCPKVAKKCFL